MDSGEIVNATMCFKYGSSCCERFAEMNVKNCSGSLAIQVSANNTCLCSGSCYSKYTKGWGKCGVGSHTFKKEPIKDPLVVRVRPVKQKILIKHNGLHLSPWNRSYAMCIMSKLQVAVICFQIFQFILNQMKATSSILSPMKTSVLSRLKGFVLCIICIVRFGSTGRNHLQCTKSSSFLGKCCLPCQDI